VSSSYLRSQQAEVDDDYFYDHDDDTNGIKLSLRLFNPGRMCTRLHDRTRTPAAQCNAVRRGIPVRLGSIRGRRKKKAPAPAACTVPPSP
jgi:hypothetical protein